MAADVFNQLLLDNLNSSSAQDHRVVVRIDSWESTSLYPNGHSVRVLGPAGELETEVQTILIENGIHVAPFSDAQVRKEASRSLRLNCNTRYKHSVNLKAFEGNTLNNSVFMFMSAN